MDFWGAFMFFLLIFLILSCCGYCCTSKKRGAVLSTPVVVTSTTHTAPGGYPVTQMPHGGVPANVYVAPYPAPNMTGTNMGMPMPGQPPMGFASSQYPAYPPMGAQPGAANMNPPSYDAAVHGVGMGAANNVPYEKQAPYNPNYSAQ